MNLNDTHLVLLSAAAQREDGLLVPPAGLTSRAIEKLAARLLRLGVADEVAVGPADPTWFERDGAAFGLRITPVGLAAIGIPPEDEPAADAAGDEPSDEITPSAPAARAGTKKALVIELLGRENGARLDELIEATGWLPHTARAALTGLRKAGHALAKDRDEEGRTVYRLGASATSAEA